MPQPAQGVVLAPPQEKPEQGQIRIPPARLPPLQFSSRSRIGRTFAEQGSTPCRYRPPQALERQQDPLAQASPVRVGHHQGLELALVAQLVLVPQVLAVQRGRPG